MIFAHWLTQPGTASVEQHQNVANASHHLAQLPARHSTEVGSRLPQGAAAKTNSNAQRVW
jgi:hypothetical protein